MSSANLWRSGFFLVSFLDTRVSPYVAIPLVVADLNSSRMVILTLDAHARRG